MNKTARALILSKSQKLLTKRLQQPIDVVTLAAAFYLAYLLRFDFNLPSQVISEMLLQLPFVVLLQLIVMALFGVYAFIWRYVGMREMRAFINAALVSALILLLVRVAAPGTLETLQVPLSVILISTALGFGGVLGLRVLRRALYERYEGRRETAGDGDKKRKPVLLVGAGRAGVMAAREIHGRGDIDLEVKGFLDDDRNKRGSVIHGIKVLGDTNDLPRLVRELEIDHIVITIAEAPGSEIRRIVRVCESIPVKARIIPGLYEILQGDVGVNRIRDVQIEDLLGREPVHLEKESMQRLISGKVVMVTGAGGSIGAELARQAAYFQPDMLLLVERAEFGLFNIDMEMRQSYPELHIAPLVADVNDEARMRAIFETYRPQVVLHAAAHKHVPMMEFNPAEAIKNNVFATHRLGELAGEFAVEAFVLISTDKAVRPTSVMGASKRIAELVVQDLQRRWNTRYVAVRFGNVIGSAGSVIPIFQEQIRKGGPVTVTHPEMKRYFMTIPEAVQLVIQAGAMGAGGEIFILDMGEPISILDLAKDTITLSGLKPDEDIEIVFTGVRPGEKLFEELEMRGENIAKTRHPKIFIGKIAPWPKERVRHAFERLRDLAQDGREQELRRFINDLLPEAQIKTETQNLSPSVLVMSSQAAGD